MFKVIDCTKTPKGFFCKMILKNDIRTAWWTSQKLNVEQTYDILNVGYSTLLRDSIGRVIDEFDVDSELPALIKKRASCAFEFDIVEVNSSQTTVLIKGKTTYIDPEVDTDAFLMARYLEYMMPKF